MIYNQVPEVSPVDLLELKKKSTKSQLDFTSAAAETLEQPSIKLLIKPEKIVTSKEMAINLND